MSNICPVCNRHIGGDNPRRKYHSGECWKQHKRETRNEYYRIIGHRKGDAERAKLVRGVHTTHQAVEINDPQVAKPYTMPMSEFERWQAQGAFLPGTTATVNGQPIMYIPLEAKG
jgi:hypothetical protein